MLRSALRRLAMYVATAAALTALLAAVLAAGGYDVAQSLGALWSSAFGSLDAFASATLVRATPLLLTGLAVSLAFSAGVFNIGAEGQLLAGAAAGTGVALALGNGGIPSVVVLVAILVSGAVAGALWAAIPMLLRVRFHVLEVISTIMMNFIAAYTVGWLVRGPLQEHTHIYPQTESIADGARLPMLIPSTRLHAGFAVALIAALVLWVVATRSAAGFRIRAVGASVRAAESAGRIDARQTIARVFLASGALAGLAGAVEVSGVTYALYENLSPGYGYTAIAVALLARLDPLWCIVTAVLFGALEAGASGMQRDANVPSAVASVLEAAVILALVAATTFRRPDTVIATESRDASVTE